MRAKFTSPLINKVWCIISIKYRLHCVLGFALESTTLNDISTVLVYVLLATVLDQHMQDFVILLPFQGKLTKLARQITKLCLKDGQYKSINVSLPLLTASDKLSKF